MFDNRTDAGQKLARSLFSWRDSEPVVVALPRGGVPVAYEVARMLGAPLDVLIARKLGAPGMPELGIGAIAQGGATYLHKQLIRDLGVSHAYLDAVSQRELDEMQRRLRVYRGARPPLDVRGKTVIVVDDGLATGVTMQAAVRALRQQKPKAIVLAVPVCAPDTAKAMESVVDAVVCLLQPEEFRAVGQWYRDFTQTRDEEVMRLLARSWQPFAPPRNSSPDVLGSYGRPT